MSDRLGQQFGNYRLVALLGQGGYAEVYLGQHVRLELQAAIKVLHAHLTDKEAEHFQQEAQTIAKLTHPAIVRVFDYDVQDGVPFLVMDYAPGGSLRQRHPKGSLVPLPQIVSYVKQVAAALQYAHERKFIHRDIKPENMLVGRHEEVLLSDFGVAALAQSTASLRTQEAIGTLPYMAPEQIDGHARPASDQYALGVVVYEWLCGARPFEGSASELVVQHLAMQPPPLSERLPWLSPEVQQVVFKALAKDAKERFASVTAFAQALEQASQGIPTQAVLPPTELPLSPPLPATAYPAPVAPPAQAIPPTQAVPAADRPVAATELVTPEGQVTDEAPVANHAFPPTAPATPLPADVPPLPKPASAAHRKGVSRLTAALLIGLAVLVIVGGILGSMSLLAHFGVLGARSSAITPVRGGTWTDDFPQDVDSLLPPGGGNTANLLIDQTLYLPLFYGDAQGVVHPGAANEVPTLQNGGISTDAKTWTFHLRPHLVWSDGAPYDARDVDFTWKLWRNPTFGFAGDPTGLTLITSADVSADYLTITFHLRRAYAPFLQFWVDGAFAPLPAHHFSQVPPEAILKSPDNLNPKVVSGPFLMKESVPGDHYTLVRNPRYYRANEGLPYLDKVVFRIIEQDAILKDLQADSITSAWLVDVSKVPTYQRLSHYTLVTPPTSNTFEAMFFNFHNMVLASHREVREAIAMAIDHQALIQVARRGIASPLCTDHGSALHPGYQPSAFCPVFDPAAANKLLEDNGWVKGPDGVRVRGGQRLEFEYSTAITFNSWRIDSEAILQRNLQTIGIKLDIQNYPTDTFFESLLPGGKASPPTGAVAGKYDIAEWANGFGYDPDDSWILACDQIPPKGAGSNLDFYCNPALDALYQQELATADAGLRQQLFNQIHNIYLTEFPFIVLFSPPPNFAMVRKGTHNYQHSPIDGGTINIWEWWCDKGKC